MAVIKYLFTLLALAILFIIIYIPYAIIDKQPLLVSPNQLNANSLNKAKQLTRSIRTSLEGPQQNRIIRINFTQLEALLALASHTFKPISTRVNDLGNAVLLSATIKLPASTYINIQTEFSDDFMSSVSSYSRIGSLEFSNSSVATVIKYALALFLNNAEQHTITHMIDKITLENKTIAIKINPSFDITQLNAIFQSKADKALKIVSASKGDINKEVLHYLAFLHRLEEHSIQHRSVSLYSITSPLFAEATIRSQQAKAQKENKAAIIALALFVSDSNLRRVLTTAFQLPRNLKTSKLSFTLHGRGDLVLHFIYSAVINIIIDNHVSFALGELKEISDSGRGGSGFSFVDLLADRAGTQFSSIAIDSHSGAIKLQQSMSLINSESDFFPSIKGLAEGLSEKRFAKIYHHKDSASYQAMLKDIDRRINALAIYH